MCSPGPACAPWTLAIVACLAAVPLHGLGGDDAGIRSPLVDIGLTTSNELPAAARPVLIAEVESIWRRAGVRLRWPAGRRDGGADESLRVLVLGRASQGTGGHAWPVGELLEDQDGRAFAVISIDAARRVVDAVAGRDEPQALVERRLGTVLGRAVAHEIGHFLLATRGHARSGLMRAHVDVSDFADLRSGGFYLDREAGAWIRASFPRALTAPAMMARFSYRPR